MPESFLFIYNPHARRGERATAVRSMQRQAGPTHTWVETTSPNNATRLAYEAALGGVDTVVAVGGDGTVHEVVCGIMMAQEGSRPKLGIVPVGTGNDFAFAVGIPSDLSRAFERVLLGEAASVDVGSIADQWGRRTHWVNSTGIGFDARVVVRSRSLRNIIKGQPLYLISTLLTLLLDHHVMDIELTLDNSDRPNPANMPVADTGNLHASDRAIMLTIGNGPREGGGFHTTPHSRIDDGQFELLLVKPLSRMGMLGLLPKVVKGTHLASSSVAHTQCTKLKLSARQPLVIHTDGEIYCTPEDNVLQVEVALNKDALQVIR